MWKLSIGILIGGCISYKPPHGIGKVTEIIVVSSKEVYLEVESLLANALERVIYTPTREQIFEIKKILPDELPKFKYRQNCLIIGVIGEALIDSLLTREAMKKLLKGEIYIFESDSLFVPNQSVLVISAPTIHKLKEIIIKNKNLIFNYFAESIRKRYKKILYKDGYQVKWTSEFETKYGFSLLVPKGWMVVHNEFGFVKLIRHYPDRIISIYWEAIPKPELNKDSAIAIRNKMGERYYEGDYVSDTLTSFYWVSFCGFRSAKLNGIWQNDEKVMGGPFRSYIFWNKGTLYLVDLHIFAPGEKKWKWIQQLEVICATFKVI